MYIGCTKIIYTPDSQNCLNNQRYTEFKFITIREFDHGFSEKYVHEIFHQYRASLASGQRQDRNRLVMNRKFHYIHTTI